MVVPGADQGDPPHCHAIARRGRGVGRAPLWRGPHLALQEVSLPSLSSSLPDKLDAKAPSCVLAVHELEFFDLLTQPISVAETWLVCSPVCDSSMYQSRILFGFVFLEYFAAVCC